MEKIDSLAFLTKKEPLLQILKERNLTLTKTRSQNFLIDVNIKNKMATYIPIMPTIIEIGAGLGHWTYFLQEKTKNLIAVEIDQGFASLLRETFSHIQILHEDFLKINFDSLCVSAPYIIAGNIPYGISTKLIESILNFPILPEQIFLVVEKSFVDEKLNYTRSVLYKKLSYLYDCYVRFDIHPRCFFPIPNKISTFVELKLKCPTQRDIPYSHWSRLINMVFRYPNKTVQNNLMAEKNISISAYGKDAQIYAMIKPKRPAHLSGDELEWLFQNLSFDTISSQK